MADATFQDIFATARDCKDLFAQCLSQKTAYSEQMLDHQRRFMSWASYLGVFASVSASLDTRLRKAPEVKKLVILLLNVLRRNLVRVLRQPPSILEAQARPPDQVDSKSDGAIYGIVGAIDRLHRLAATIRHPSWSDDVEKVQKYSRSQPPDGFEDIILLIIDFKFPDAPESLRMQLVKSIIYRRNRLRYQRNHQGKLAAERKDDDAPVKPPNKTDSLPKHDRVPSEEPKKEDASQTPKPKSVAVRSDTEPTIFDRNKYRESQDKPAPSAPTIKSSGSSDRVGDTVYPRPPAVPANSSHTECQFCSKEVAKVDINNPKWWRSHVNTDMRPYVCIFDDCGSFPPSFSNRNPLFSHMRERHGPDWAQYIHRPFQHHCTLGHDTNISFATEDGLFQHLVAAHSEAFQESELRDIASRSKVAAPSLEAICVLCNEDVSKLPEGTESKGTEHGEGKAGQGKLKLLEDQDSTGLKTAERAPKTTPEAADKSTKREGPKARVGFVLPSDYREPDSTATTAEDTPYSGENVGQKDFGSIRAKLHQHLADHLRSVAFLSLRWWDEERDSGSQGSNEVRMRGDAKSNSSQDVGDSNSEATSTSETSEMSDYPKWETETTHLIKDLRRKLKRSLCRGYSLTGKKTEFLPADELDGLVTEGVVGNITSGLSQTLDNGATIARYVCAFAKKLFAISVLSGQTGKIQGFFFSNITDEALPLDRGFFVESLNSAWREQDMVLWLRYQWILLAPVFLTHTNTKSPSCQVWGFDDETILPFTSVISLPPIDDQDASVVEIHVQHDNLTFDRTPYMYQTMSFLLLSGSWDSKSLDELARDPKVQVWNRFDRLSSPGIVPLLGVFHYRSKNYLIFPYTEKTLDNYWRTAPDISSELNLRPWFANEAISLAKSVQLMSAEVDGFLLDGFLRDRPELDSLHFYPHISPRGLRLTTSWGPHSPGEIIFADFKVASNTSNLYPGTAAPECAALLSSGVVQNASYVWSLGAVYLEGIIWLLGGSQLLEEFRMGKDHEVFVDGIPRNSFWRFEKGSDNKIISLNVKDSVRKAMDKLTKHENCSRYLIDFLEFIKERMLVINPITRIGIHDLIRHLDELAQRCNSDQSYYAQRVLTHHDYTVGWICALPIEMAAAVGMLDERHDSLPQDSRDHNNYVLGRIGPHNVVIACLPAGVQGVTAAARVASDMLSTFTSLRFGLMVGIGGGVPSRENDIRLGDVVVSQPTKNSGGVIQYDFGKTVQEGKFEQTGILNRPPDVLLHAVASLQARHEIEEPALSRYLSEMGSKYPRLASASVFPGTEHDYLFEATYDHPATGITCANCRSDQLIMRTERGDNIPVIHYGLIASGNQIIRDGKTRERLRSELPILCFEMEAAGLVDYFPCLVIRGICDYADSHKSKQWQPYAAATAAAYAKELLNVISATQVVQTMAIRGPSSS